MNDSPWRDPEVLERMYREQEMAMPQIAERSPSGLTATPLTPNSANKLRSERSSNYDNV